MDRCANEVPGRGAQRYSVRGIKEMIRACPKTCNLFTLFDKLKHSRHKDLAGEAYFTPLVATPDDSRNSLRGRHETSTRSAYGTRRGWHRGHRAEPQDIPALLLGLQYLYSDETFRARLLALLDEHVLSGIDGSVGRPGMEMWRILVMGVVKQGLGCDFDRLHELENGHRTLRRLLAIRTFGTGIATSTIRRWTR